MRAESWRAGRTHGASRIVERLETLQEAFTESADKEHDFVRMNEKAHDTHLALSMDEELVESLDAVFLEIRQEFEVFKTD